MWPHYPGLRVGMQSIVEFLKDLPCHHEQNFSLFNTENGIRTSLKRPSVYLPTDEVSSDQSKSKKIRPAINYLYSINIFCLHFQLLSRKRRTFCCATCINNGKRRFVGIVQLKWGITREFWLFQNPVKKRDSSNCNSAAAAAEGNEGMDGVARKRARLDQRDPNN